MLTYARPIPRSIRGYAFGCARVCLCAAALTAAASAQDATARLTESVMAITAGDDNAARREAIVSRLRAAGVEPTVEPFGEGRGAGANVVVTLAGGGSRTIVIGAHLDRVNVGRGAVDNAGSCATLIELVAAVRTSPLTRTTLRVVFFDREENGLLGSRAYFAAPDRRPDYAVNLDIFAYGDTIFATYSHPDGVLRHALQAAGQATRLPIRDVPRGSYPMSDHATMMNAGIETLGLALVDAADVNGILAISGGKADPQSVPRILRIIHSPNDTLTEVHPEQMARGVALIDELIRTIDRSD